MTKYHVTPSLGAYQVRPGAADAPPIATFSTESDARAFAAFKESSILIAARNAVEFLAEVSPSGRVRADLIKALRPFDPTRREA